MRRLLTFGIVAVLFLTACSSTPSSAQGEVFTSALTGLPSNIDPAVNEGNPSRWVGQVRGGTLVEYDPRSLPGAGCSQLASVEDLRPGVAESWTIEADGAVTFALSDAISAYGNEITAEDVKWTYDRLVALEAGFPGFLMRFIAGLCGGRGRSHRREDRAVQRQFLHRCRRGDLDRIRTIHH